MRTRSRLVLSLTAALLLGTCGGEAESVQGPEIPPPPPRETLDFGPVAGRWEGVMSTPGGFSSSLTVTLQRSALESAKVGVVVYPGWGCEMDLLAIKAEPPAYQVDERLVSGPSGCAEGYGFLTHDPSAGTLVYTFVSHANSTDTGTATLERP